ncbi:MAG: 3-isopropylmalate dehydratase small subunit [Cyanobacteria bacterium P01_A01_bin.105]
MASATDCRITTLSGKGMPLPGNDIDTDRIIPARFLRCVSFEGLGEQVFADDRQQRQQSASPHPFDQPQYQGATILVVNRNFGCGSSREHAPQAIHRWGIQAIVGESFAEIFLGNCIAIGMPCVTATSDVVTQLQAHIEQTPTASLTVDLNTLQVTCGDRVYPVELASGPQQMFLNGTWDACGQLLQQRDAIQATAANLPYVQWAS